MPPFQKTCLVRDFHFHAMIPLCIYRKTPNAIFSVESECSAVPYQLRAPQFALFFRPRRIFFPVTASWLRSHTELSTQLPFPCFSPKFDSSARWFFLSCVAWAISFRSFTLFHHPNFFLFERGRFSSGSRTPFLTLPPIWRCPFSCPLLPVSPQPPAVRFEHV